MAYKIAEVLVFDNDTTLSKTIDGNLAITREDRESEKTLIKVFQKEDLQILKDWIDENFHLI